MFPPLPIPHTIRFLLAALIWTAFAGCAHYSHAENLASYSLKVYDPQINSHIVRITRSMPSGGGYSTRRDAFEALYGAGIVWDEGRSRLHISPRKAQPSFCSSACYLVLVQLLQKCRDSSGKSPFNADVWRALAVQPQQPDGSGIWGRVNANGPGLAKFIHDIGAGYSFTDYNHAQPGDFLKIFWSHEIGRREFGHLVVYLGQEKAPDGTIMVRFWSSNKDIGYSVKTVPRDSIKRALFTRITTLRAFDRIPLLPANDEWLAAHLTRSFTPQEMHKKCGVRTINIQHQK